jgi:integrase
VYLGRDEDTGKHRYLTRTVRGTKREAETVCAALVAQASQGQFSKSAGTMGELLEQWMDHIEPNVSPATLAAYRIYLDRWILPKFATFRVDRLRPAELDRFYAGLRDKLSPASVLKAHTIIRAALGQAVKWQMIATNPASLATPPRVRRPPIQPPSPEQVAALLAAADEFDPDFGLYLRLAAVTGARRGELCALRWSDVNLRSRELVVARALTRGTRELVEKPTKTHKSRRIALDPGTVAALERQRKIAVERAGACGVRLAADAYIFSRDVEGKQPWRPDSGVTSRFERIRRSVGLDEVRLHDLRHYVATRLLDAGMPVRTVSERLGHANATTTLGIYAQSVPATDRRAADLLGGLLDDPTAG